MHKWILLGISVLLSSCLTTRVSEMVSYQVKPEKLLTIKSACLTEDRTIDIVWLAKYEDSNKEHKYHIRYQIDTLVAFNRIPNTSWNYTDEMCAQTAVSRIGYFLQHDTAWYCVSLDREKLKRLNFSSENKCQIDILSNLIVDQVYGYPDFSSDGQIVLTYQFADKQFIAFGTGREWTRNRWGYCLYPFSVAADLVTFPIQFIYLLVKFEHPFKN